MSHVTKRGEANPAGTALDAVVRSIFTGGAEAKLDEKTILDVFRSQDARTATLPCERVFDEFTKWIRDHPVETNAIDLNLFYFGEAFSVMLGTVQRLAKELSEKNPGSACFFRLLHHERAVLFITVGRGLSAALAAGEVYRALNEERSHIANILPPHVIAQLATDVSARK